MRILLLLLLLCGSCARAYGAPAIQSGDASASKGWLLKQQTTIGGQISFTITDKAIKIDSPTCGYIAVAKAPDWQICVYRPDTKEMGYVNLKDWIHFNTSAVGTTDENTIEHPISRKLITPKGLPVKAYLYTYPGEKTAAAPFQTAEASESSNIFVESYMLSTAPQAMAIQRQVMNCNSIDGCLISCSNKAKDTGEFRWTIRTLSLKPQLIAKSEFAIPSGYKQLKRIDQHFKYKNLSKPLDDMAEMMQMGEPKQKKEKTAR
ncbi:MAG: hypothetical protein KA255_20895 [Candidatus Obscuribacter sp.]|nr:hypothetical protein [Candidatus Obscuribacter sp.]